MRRGPADPPRVRSDYLIRPVREADLPMLRAWRARPHVRRWWGDPSLEPEAEKLAEPRVAIWIGALAGRPFAFIQDYDVHGWPDHHFAHLPAPSRGMDLYIGEPELIGRGHGTALIRRHAEHLFAAGARAIGIDPHPENLAARRAYEKAGFRVVGGPVETRWGTAILMERAA